MADVGESREKLGSGLSDEIDFIVTRSGSGVSSGARGPRDSPAGSGGGRRLLALFFSITREAARSASQNDPTVAYLSSGSPRAPLEHRLGVRSERHVTARGVGRSAIQRCMPPLLVVPTAERRLARGRAPSRGGPARKTSAPDRPGRHRRTVQGPRAPCRRSKAVRATARRPGRAPAASPSRRHAEVEHVDLRPVRALRRARWTRAAYEQAPRPEAPVHHAARVRVLDCVGDGAE